MQKAGVAVIFPRMVCYKMVGLDTTLCPSLDLAHIVGDAHSERLQMPPLFRGREREGQTTGSVPWPRAGSAREVICEGELLRLIADAWNNGLQSCTATRQFSTK